MTSQSIPRTLTQMQFYSTRYEVAVTAGDVTIRLTFTERRGKMILLKIAQVHAGQVLALIDDPDNTAATYTKATGWTFGSARVYYTGRTERDVANSMGRIV